MVKSIFGELFEGEIFIPNTILTNLCQYFVELLPLPDLLSKLSKTQRTISRGTPKHQIVKKYIW